MARSIRGLRPSIRRPNPGHHMAMLPPGLPADVRAAALRAAEQCGAILELGHRGPRAGAPANGRGLKVYPIGWALVAILALSACGSSGSADTSSAGQALRDKGQTMTANAGVMRDAGQMMLDNGQAMMDAGQAMMNRGKALSQDDMVRLGQQMMDKGKAMREAGQPMMRKAQTMMTDGQQMTNRGQGMMGR